jgi:hypothetical protein
MELKGMQRLMMAMAENAGGEEVHVAWPKEKRAVVALEQKGLVTVRRTTVKCAEFTEWYYRAVTP